MTHSLRKAFTMIELVMVTVVLGIVASIGAEIIAKTYQGYIVQRAQHRASIKTELAATQIANRLAHAIPGTVIRRVDLLGGVQDINNAPVGDPNVLQWVSADMDSFNAISSADGFTPAVPPLPGWSGFADVDASPLAGTTISTPGSDLNLAATIIGNLGGAVATSVIHYNTDNIPQERAVAGLAGTNIALTPTVGSISEHYKLAWTSYALEARANGDLFLHYNFAPTRNAAIAGVPQLLLRNVTVFQFRGDGQTIRFKICVDEDIGEVRMVSICKEKAVF